MNIKYRHVPATDRSFIKSSSSEKGAFQRPAVSTRTGYTNNANRTRVSTISTSYPKNYETRPRSLTLNARGASPLTSSEATYKEDFYLEDVVPIAEPIRLGLISASIINHLAIQKASATPTATAFLSPPASLDARKIKSPSSTFNSESEITGFKKRHTRAAPEIPPPSYSLFPRTKVQQATIPMFTNFPANPSTSTTYAGHYTFATGSNNLHTLQSPVSQTASFLLPNTLHKRASTHHTSKNSTNSHKHNNTSHPQRTNSLPIMERSNNGSHGKSAYYHNPTSSYTVPYTVTYSPPKAHLPMAEKRVRFVKEVIWIGDRKRPEVRKLSH